MVQHWIRIAIGDWSEDGHGMCKNYFFISNYETKLLQQAYKESCQLLGVQFHDGENYTGIKEVEEFGSDRLVCTEYEDNQLSQTVVKLFKQHHCPLQQLVQNGNPYNEKEFAELILWFISLSMPTDFQYHFEQLPNGTRVQSLNGYWDKELNVQFGYGLFV